MDFTFIVFIVKHEPGEHELDSLTHKQRKSRAQILGANPPFIGQFNFQLS